MFELLPLKRQYFVSGDICDILATDKNNRLVIIELKNVEDRYIVQQLTRYYHSVLEEKPFQQQINYQLPVRLIVIAPSFHRHSWIDRKYHKLNFEFMSFVTMQQESEVYLHLTDLNTKKVSQVKIIDISLLKRVNISQSNNTIVRTERGDIAFTTSLNDILLYYVFVKNAYKLGLPELESSEIKRLNNQGYPTKVSKLFKIRVKEQRAKSGFREVSIRVPSSIRVGVFVIWVQHNVPTATEVISPSGSHHMGFFHKPSKSDL
ncbi:MAG: DUF91 domain-containing protein [Tatlockia sp.]|nr:DUF91 domain-containing protein [Tatlockia sp.]